MENGRENLIKAPIKPLEKRGQKLEYLIDDIQEDMARFVLPESIGVPKLEIKRSTGDNEFTLIINFSFITKDNTRVGKDHTVKGVFIVTFENDTSSNTIRVKKDYEIKMGLLAKRRLDRTSFEGPINRFPEKIKAYFENKEHKQGVRKIEINGEKIYAFFGSIEPSPEDSTTNVNPLMPPVQQNGTFYLKEAAEEKRKTQLRNLPRVKTLTEKYTVDLVSGTLGEKANAKRHLDKLSDLDKLESYFTDRIGSGEPEEDEAKDEEALAQIQKINGGE